MDYSFSTTPEGNVQTSQGGKVISTGTADNAALNYGYKAPVSPAPAPATPPAVQQTTTALRTTAAQNSSDLNNRLATSGTSAAISNANPTSTGMGSGNTNGSTIAQPTPIQTLRTSGGTYTGTDGNTYYNYDGTSASNAPAPISSTTGSSGSGSATATPGVNADGSFDLTTDAGIKAKLSSDVSTATTNAQTEVSQTNATLDTISANASAATQDLISSIKSTFGASIDAMNRSNQVILNGKIQSGIRSGITRYASGVQDSILTDEMQQGLQRVNTLNGQMLSAIASAEQAQNSEDLTVFNDRMTQVNKINDDMNTEVQSLQKNALDNLNQLQTSATNAANLAKQKQDEQLQMSTRVAPTLAAQLAQYSDPKDQASFLQEYSKQSGIPTDVLMGDIASYNDTQSKNKLDLENVQNEIDNRNAQTSISQENADTAATKEETANPSDVFSAINARLNTKDSSGMPYLDSNGYFTKQGFENLVNAAGENGVSRADFLKQYGQYLDPNGYDNYLLTPADKAALTNTNKSTPIVVPPSTNS